jgi:carbamate kinase
MVSVPAPKERPLLTVVALGDNALLSPAQRDGLVQLDRVEMAAAAVAEISANSDVVVTHGILPQLNMLSLRDQAGGPAVPLTIDVLDAESEGMIGYLLNQELGNRLMDRNVAALLTQVVVDADDPAFCSPIQPIGRQFTEKDARHLAAGRGWAMARRGGRFRRVLAAPEPRHIVELAAVRQLVDAGTIVICAGGGVPVAAGPDGRRHGVEAVVDKDLAAALLAVELDADRLLLLTDVPAVFIDWGSPDATPLRLASPAQLRTMTFPAQSMAPKVEAACRFVEATGRTAGIGALPDATAILKGEAGTLVRRD